MATTVNVITQKVPEKLFILRDRGIGLITRIYTIKKIQADATLKPKFMSEKHLETPIKLLEKKFPDCKDPKILTAIRPLKQDISKALSSYYSTLLDVMHYRQCVEMLLNSVDGCNIFFDITLNFDLTRLYLDVVCVYMRLMILLSRIDDRKAVLGLFNAANYSVHGTSDSNFDELAKMVTFLYIWCNFSLQRYDDIDYSDGSYTYRFCCLMHHSNNWKRSLSHIEVF